MSCFVFVLVLFSHSQVFAYFLWLVPGDRLSSTLLSEDLVVASCYPAF